MSQIIEMYGTRSDGVTIGFTKDDVEKIPYADFVSVTIKELCTPEEVLRRYTPTDESDKTEITTD